MNDYKQLGEAPNRRVDNPALATLLNVVVRRVGNPALATLLNVVVWYAALVLALWGVRLCFSGLLDGC